MTSSNPLPTDVMQTAERAETEYYGSTTEVIAKAIMAERERCANICNGWLEQHGSRPITHVGAAEYAGDAVKDILELIVADPGIVRESRSLSIIERIT